MSSSEAVYLTCQLYIYIHDLEDSCGGRCLINEERRRSSGPTRELIMWRRQTFTVIFVVTTWLVYMCKTDVTFTRDHTLDGVMKVNGSPYQEVSAKSVCHCGTFCTPDWCSSFFFLPTTRKCLLNEMVFTTSVGGQSSPGAWYFKADSVACPSRDGYVWLRAYRTCIKFYQTPMIFMDSYRTCTSVGTRLAVLNTTAKYKAVTTYLAANSISILRISIGGARDGAINGSRTTWNSALHPLYWVNGLRMAFSGPDTFWWYGNPDNKNGTEGCLELYQGQLWNDGLCDTLKPFICEKLLN